MEVWVSELNLRDQSVAGAVPSVHRRSERFKPLTYTHIAHPFILRAWSLWEYEIPQEKLQGRKVLEVAVKATDTSYNVQPERIEPYWNLVRV